MGWLPVVFSDYITVAYDHIPLTDVRPEELRLNAGDTPSLPLPPAGYNFHLLLRWLELLLSKFLAPQKAATPFNGSENRKSRTTGDLTRTVSATPLARVTH